MSARAYSAAHQAILDAIEASRNATGLKLNAIAADLAGIRSDATIAGEALVRAMADKEIRDAERHVLVMATLGAVLERLDGDPPAPSVLLGAATGNDVDWAELDGLVGPMPARRTFESTFVPDFMAGRARADPAAGRLSVWSFKVNGDYRGFITGAWDERIRVLLGSIPDDHETRLVMQHEPENDPGIVAADWRAAQARLATLAYAYPNVEVVPVLMGWTFNPQSGRNPQDWFDSAMYDAGIRTIGIDEYQPADSTWQDWPTRAGRFTPTIYAWGCVPAICEVGCPDRPEYPDRKVQWIRDLHAWAVEYDAPFVCWFNYVSGVMSSDETYLLDSSPAVTEAWRSLVA